MDSAASASAVVAAPRPWALASPDMSTVWAVMASALVALERSLWLLPLLLPPLLPLLLLSLSLLPLL